MLYFNEVAKRTSRNFITYGALALVLSATAAYSQDGKVGVGVAAVGQFPVGDFQDVAGFGVGGLGSLEVGAYPGLSITARSGYIQHFDQDDYTVSLIPIMGGAKVSSGADGVVYLAGELGAVITKVDYSGSGILAPDDKNETNLGWGVGVGSMAGPVDLRVTFNVWDAGRMSDTMTIGLSLGLTVWSL